MTHMDAAHGARCATREQSAHLWLRRILAWRAKDGRAARSSGSRVVDARRQNEVVVLRCGWPCRWSPGGAIGCRTLGMTPVKAIAECHGARIERGEASLGGLRVEVQLPRSRDW